MARPKRMHMLILALLLAGNLFASEITGIKWRDHNENAIQEPNEPNLPDVTIYLDLNDSGDFDPNDPNTVTDEQGRYSFTDLPAGIYSVREVLPSGWYSTFPPLDGELGFRQVFFAPGEPTGGLLNARGVAVAPDGLDVYATGYGDSAVVAFNRNRLNGILLPRQVLYNDPNNFAAMQGPWAVAVSPDSWNVYVTSITDGSIVAFMRMLDGSLAYLESHIDGANGIDGLRGARDITISPDSASIYVAGYYDDAVAAFQRNTITGRLTFVEALFDGLNGGSGLDGATAVAISPDGENVYAAGSRDDALTVFQREPDTSGLTWTQTLTNNSGSVRNLDKPMAVVVSPDGNHVYVAAEDADAVIVFQRNPSTGHLTYLQTRGAPGPVDLAISPDGLHLYAAGFNDNQITALTRHPVTGLLTNWYTIHDNTDPLDGLQGIHAIATDLLGNNVYTVGNEHAIVTFKRGHHIFYLPENSTAYIHFANKPWFETDFDDNAVVDANDLQYFAGKWLENDCNQPLSDCKKPDLDQNGTVNFSDFRVFSRDWQKTAP